MKGDINSFNMRYNSMTCTKWLQRYSFWNFLIGPPLVVLNPPAGCSSVARGAVEGDLGGVEVDPFLTGCISLSQQRKENTTQRPWRTTPRVFRLCAGICSSCTCGSGLPIPLGLLGLCTTATYGWSKQCHPCLSAQPNQTSRIVKGI